MNSESKWIAKTTAGFARRGATIRAANDFRPNYASQFATESEALPDSSASWADRPIVLTVKAGVAHLMFAESHLNGLAAGFRAGMPCDPPTRAAARQILEASAYAYWLLDTNIDARRRACRGLEEARYALVDRSK